MAARLECLVLDSSSERSTPLHPNSCRTDWDLRPSFRFLSAGFSIGQPNETATDCSRHPVKIKIIIPEPRAIKHLEGLCTCKKTRVKTRFLNWTSLGANRVTRALWIRDALKYREPRNLNGLAYCTWPTTDRMIFDAPAICMRACVRPKNSLRPDREPFDWLIAHCLTTSACQFRLSVGLSVRSDSSWRCWHVIWPSVLRFNFSSSAVWLPQFGRTKPLYLLCLPHGDTKRLLNSLDDRSQWRFESSFILTSWFCAAWISLPLARGYVEFPLLWHSRYQVSRDRHTSCMQLESSLHSHLNLSLTLNDTNRTLYW